MASGSVLSGALPAAAIAGLSPDTRQRLEGLFSSKEETLTSMKTQLEKLKVNSEQRFQQLEAEWLMTNSRLEKESGDAEELRNTKEKLEERLKKSEDDLSRWKERTEGSLETHQELSRANEQLNAEKQELVTIIDRKSKEIERLNDEWQAMSEKLGAADMAKAELQMRLDEVEHEDLSMKFKEKRFEQEKAMLSSQIDWLEKSLKEKTEEVLSLRKEKSNAVSELKAELSTKEGEIQQLQERAEVLERTLTNQTKRMEETQTKLQESLDTVSKNEEQFNGELEAQKKLTDIFKQTAEEHDGRVRELMSAVEELQNLLKLATEAQEELEVNKKEMVAKHSNIEKELVGKIEKMENELEKANDLITAARKKGLAPLSEQELSALSPTAAAASSFIKSGMTMTQMYSEYVKATESLHSEQMENKRLNEYMDQILQEIEEKAPVLQQQREDYEKSLETTNQLSIRLDAALLECEQQRVVAEDAERRRGHMTRENQRLKQQTVDLGQQIRVLLREVQEARGGPVMEQEELEADVSSSDVTSSSQVIDRHLVTFKNIEELQKQNADLLNVVRDLSEKKEAEEKETLASKTSELKSKLDTALEELEGMRDARRRQMEMVESVVRQRDMYRVLLAQSGADPPPLSQSLYQRSPSTKMAALPGTPSPARGRQAPDGGLETPAAPASSSGVNSEEKDRALEALQAEFETYRKENAENQKMLNAQLDSMRKELSDSRVQSAKLSSQLEFASERFKILQGTADSYKNEIVSTREKNQRISGDLVKAQQTASSLSEDLQSKRSLAGEVQRQQNQSREREKFNQSRIDLLAAQEKATRLEIQCQNLRSEKNLAGEVERQLGQENQSLRNEQRNQNLLLTNLQQIQTNLERSDFETKSRLTNQLGSLEREITVLRRKLDGEGEQHKTVLKTWEDKVRELERQLANEMESHRKTKDDLTKTRVDLQAEKQRCSVLVAAQIKLESALKEAKDLESRKPSAEGSDHTDMEVRELKKEVAVRDREIQELKDKAGKAEQHVEQYKTISAAVEQSLKEQNEASQTFKTAMEKRVKDADAAILDLEKRLAESETDREELRTENQGLGDAATAQTAELRKNLSKLQDELKDATTRCTDAENKEASARQDSQEQSRISQEAREKYEREVLLHAADVQQLITIKEQLTNHNKKLSEAEEAAKKAQDELGENQRSWDEQLRVQKEQVKNIQNRCDELEGQNGMLHQQLEKLSSQIIETQTAARGSTSVLDLSFNADEKSAEQLLEVIKFLRRDKEIAETRLEVIQGEGLRVKQKCESLRRQMTDLENALREERDRAQVMAHTTAQQENLLKKVETLNSLTDSNRLLREEKDKLEQDLQQAQAKVQQLEGDIVPMQEEIRLKSARLSVVNTERSSLAEEARKWRTRANQLVEQCNKVDPDEQKRLVQEKESNKKTISDLREETQRYKAEISKLNGQLNNARTEISKLNMAQSTAQSKHNLETQKLRTEISKLNMAQSTAQSKHNLETQKLREELNSVRADLKSKLEQVQAKAAEIEEKNKINNQVKRLGRKYKNQFEEAKAELDKVQAKLISQEAQAAKPNPETEAKIQELEEDVRSLSQEITALRQAEETLKTQLAEKEERSEKQQRVLKQAKQKITQLTGDKEKHHSDHERLHKEFSDLQAAKNQADRKMEGQRQELQLRIAALEREVKEVKADRDKIRSERAQEQLARDSQMDQMEGHPSSLLTTPDRASSSREEPPPTANIKPLSSPASAVGTAKATASIRPIAVTPSTSSSVSSSTSTRMATVMPHTIEQHALVSVPDDHEVQTSDPPSLPMVSATPIQAVTPTQQTPLIARTEPMAQQEPEPYMDDTPISGPSTSAEPSSSSSSGPPSQQNIPSSGKRQRDEPSESDQSSSIEREILPPTEKRQRVTPQPIARVQAQEEPPLVLREAEQRATAEVLPERSDREPLATASGQPEQVEVVMGSVAPEQVERVVGTVQAERAEQIVAPSNQVVTPSNQVAPSNQIVAPSNQIVAPSSQVVAPSSQVVAPSSQVVAPSSQVVAPSSQAVAPSSQVVAPSSQVVTPSNQIVAPSSQMVAPSSQVVAPSNQVVAPSNQADAPQASQSSSSEERHNQGDRSTEPQSTGPPEKMEQSDERLEDQKPAPSRSQEESEEDVILVEDDSDGEPSLSLPFSEEVGGSLNLPFPGEVGESLSLPYPGEVGSDGDKDVSDYEDVEEYDDGHDYEGEEGTDYSEDEMDEQEGHVAGMGEGESPVTSAEEMEGREVVEIIDEEEEHGEASQIGSDSPGPMEQQEQGVAAQSSSRGQGPPPKLVIQPPEHGVSQTEAVHTAPAPAVVSGVPRPRERLSSTGRQHPPPFPFAPFEDTGDDCQVPSTPTLFVPHRNDGFAEAINSPLVQPGHQRFHFSAPEATDTRAPGLAQLASQGDLGVDDTMIYLPGGDDEAGTSRNVPMTPLQSLTPVSVVEASPSLAEAIPRPESTVAPSGADGVQTSSSVRPSSRGTDDAGIGQQRSSASPSPPTSSEQVSQPSASLTSSVRPREEEDRLMVSGSEDVSAESGSAAASSGRAETSGTQPNSGNAQPSSSGDGETKKQRPRIVWGDGPSTTQQAVQPQSSSQETVRPTPRPQTAIRGNRGRLIHRTFPARGRFSRGGRGGTS